MINTNHRRRLQARRGPVKTVVVMTNIARGGKFMYSFIMVYLTAPSASQIVWASSGRMNSE
jgi:hypothetical protein